MSSEHLLIRHAVAVERERWQGEDAFRPLTADGERQAEALRRWLARFEPSPLLSSPTLRCVATLLPYAQAHQQLVVRRPELLSDRVPDAISLTGRMLGGGGALCTHGEVIEPVLQALAVQRRGGPTGSSAKGSVWVLQQTVAGVLGRYVSPEQVEREARLYEAGRCLTER